ncbi:hypothetical protein J5N97_001195 [Dioscorea zingiberensis]|uniref:Inhibitor I9 domain-containing protein n=1 Tax=Dioscorea zingiberensis TaxID=325984 RepID=A0A9D5BUC0_9LILI|nr:hypothetical protein J5N97_001195 [Dioscorea zingiberensis]
MVRKEKSCTFFIILFLIFSSFDHSLFVNGQTMPIVEEKGDEIYIVHVQRPKGKELLGDEDREAWHRSFLPNKTLDSGRPRLIYSYRDVIGGFAARLTKEEVKAMESMEGFMHAEPDKDLSPMTTYTPKFLGLSQSEGLWVNSFMGQGVIIGVIDNGITPGHSSFKDNLVDSPMPPPPPNAITSSSVQCHSKEDESDHREKSKRAGTAHTVRASLPAALFLMLGLMALLKTLHPG